MENDGERTQLLQQILDLLLAGGYFRARISALSVFDKLTGGLAWCITFSKVDVDFDIFYDDDATLYYKIKVGEAIEEALQRMGCPNPLQAHQIQGLDYQAVLPVVQWLVKRVLASLEEFGYQARRYAHLQYQETYKLPNEISLQQARLAKIEVVLQSSNQEPLPNLYKSAKADSFALSKDLVTVSRCLSLAEVPERGLSFHDRDPIAFATQRSTLSEAIEDSLPRDVGHKTDSAHYQQVQNLEKSMDAQGACIARLEIEMDAARLLIKDLGTTVIKQDERRADTQAAIEELQGATEIAGVKPVVEKLMELLERAKILEKQEADFRADCRRKRGEMQTYIKQLKGPAAMAAEDDKHGTEINNAHNADLQKRNILRSELAGKNRAVALLQRRLDEMPSQTELMQCERRFVELYLHIQRKLRETRKYYATYNALAEANELTVKELSLLNSIHIQFEVAMMTPGGRSKFVESIEGIAKGVQQKLYQIERRFEAEQSTYSFLKEKHTAAVAAQRQYYAVVKLFQEECARSEKLQSKLDPGSQSGNQI